MFSPGCSSNCSAGSALIARQVGEVRERHHLALIGAQLRQPHRRVLVDREHQRIELRLRAPEILERADSGWWCRAGTAPARTGRCRSAPGRSVPACPASAAHRHIPATGSMAKSIAMSARNGACGSLSAKRTVWSSSLSIAASSFVEAHVVEVVVSAAGHLVVRVVVLPLPLERKDHVVGVEVARRLENLVRLPLHAVAQMEGEHLAVGRDVPPFGQRRLRPRVVPGLNCDQAVVDRQVGVERRARWC